ncbi:MAG: DUF262 domain-containing protein, partial [Verrucomicrobiae bacterium]|nr:DUF262 domain-containing protein [Verrucomicrobiae bacterium]
RVVPDTLDGLVLSVRRGEYRIPQFQREYVWEKTKVVSLFDSIYHEYPIGSFFLWKADREHNRLFRHSVDLGIPEIKDDDNVSFILDGQQRITSLYVTLIGLTVRGTDYSRICFDVKEAKFTHRQPDNKRYLSVHDIWDQNLLKLSKEVPEEYHDTLGNCHQILKTYPISLVEVRGKDLPAVCDIFQRINQAGKRLDRFDLISAMTFSPDFDLREKFKGDIVSKLTVKSFGKISSNIVTQLMALVKKGGCTESVQFSLTAKEIHEMWPDTVSSILLATDILREAMGVKQYNYLPYNGQITLLAYFFAKSGQRSLTEPQLEWVKRWFWRSSFGKHYGAGGDSRIGRDSVLFDQLAKGEFPEFEPPLTLTTGELIRTKMTWTGSAVRNAFLCLLADRRPLHLINNSPLDLVNGGISDFTSPEKHHIFPQAHLRREREEVEVHALPNFCFLTAELNKRILDTRPSLYFPELQKENPEFAKAARCQLLPTGDDSGVSADDYLTFLEARSQLLLEEIERLTGLSTAPAADQRQATVEDLETRLRNVIHTTLLEGHGQKYWKQNIPQGIRDGAQGRIDHEIRKQPGLSAADYADARAKLDFCNVTDYVQIVSNGANWPLFESTFRRKSEFERHMEAFAEFRNAVMHNRQMTEIVRKAGDLAIVWLETVLATEEGENNATEGEEPADEP